MYTGFGCFSTSLPEIRRRRVFQAILSHGSSGQAAPRELPAALSNRGMDCPRPCAARCVRRLQCQLTFLPLGTSRAHAAVRYTTWSHPSLSELLFQEQNNFRSCCPQGLRVIFSVKADRNLTTTPEGKKHRNKYRKLFSLGLGQTVGQSLVEIPVSVKKPFLVQDPLPCNTEALIVVCHLSWCCSISYFQGPSYPEDCLFSQTPV